MKIAVGGLQSFSKLPKNITVELLAEEQMGLGGLPNSFYVENKDRHFGVSERAFSLGTPGPMDQVYINSLRSFLTISRAEWLNLRLGFSTSGGIYFHQHFPVTYSRYSLEFLIAKIFTVKKELQIPLCVENIDHKSPSIRTFMREAVFLKELVRSAGVEFILNIGALKSNCEIYGEDFQVVYNELAPLSKFQIVTEETFS